MIRQAVWAPLILASIALLLNTAIGQQAGPPDKIVIRDKDKKDGSTKTYEGTLKLAPNGYQIMSPEGKVLAAVSPADIVKVIPGELVGVDRGDMLAQLSLEDKKTKKDYETARLAYKALLDKAATAPPKTKQYLSFKRAIISTKLLDESDDEEWAKQIDPTVKEWDDYLSTYKTGWEVWPAARISARLDIELSKFKEAGKLWKQMMGKEYELPADLKLEATLQLIDSYIREGPGGYSSAATAAEEAAKTAVSPVLKDKLAIYARTARVEANPSPEALSAAVKEIEEKIGASKDITVRGVGYGMIGELYLAAKRPRDAMWAFLWVETVYNQDKDEALKAMVRLSQIFKAQMDEDHERLYREKIRRFRQQL